MGHQDHKPRDLLPLRAEVARPKQERAAPPKEGLPSGGARDPGALPVPEADSVRYLESIINSVADPIFVKDEQHRWVTLNDAYCRFMGYPREKLLGRSDFDFFPPYQAQVFWDKDQQVLQSGEENVNEEEFTDSAGTRHIIVTKKTLFVGSSGVRYIVGVIRDQTREKETEQQIHHLNQQLARQVKQLDLTNKELETFSYSVSHDLRSPLCTIDGFAQILVDDYGRVLPPEALVNLQRIQTAAQRMAQLIEHYLQLSRVTRVELKSEVVDLSALARTVANQLRQSAPHRTVEFIIATGLTARGDPQLLGVVMENLLGNAWKFTRNTPLARIEVGTAQASDCQAFMVRDNGAGFDPAYADRLFQPFRRLHSSHQFEGTGVGLATVQRIIGKHGGRVWAEGATDQGATFYFCLPE